MTFFSLFQSHRKNMALALFYIIAANILSLALPWGMKMIIDEALEVKNVRLLSAVTAGLILILIMKAFLNVLRKNSAHVLGEKVICSLRKKIYWKSHRLSLKSIKDITPTEIITRIISDVENIRRFVFNDLMECLYACLSIIFIAGILWMMEGSLTVFSFAAMPLFFLIYTRSVPALQKGYEQLRAMNGSLSSRIQEVLSGMSVVRSCGARDYEKERFLRKQDALFGLSAKNHRVHVRLWAATDFLTFVFITAVLWLGGLKVIQGKLSAGELVAFYSYLTMLFAPVVRLVMVNDSYQEARASLKRINEIMDVPDAPEEKNIPAVRQEIKNQIVFQNVCFGYDPQRVVLDDISFSVRAGEHIGVVGVSGSGKTTLMSLLLRFFDPQKGRIAIDGFDLKDLSVDNYRKHMAVVLQDDYLFNGTVRENICYGQSAGSLEDIEKSARMAQAHEFIMNLEAGYETVIGEGGLSLSSGQRQRVALARAFLRKPSLLILDEATSALDAMTENEIQEAVARHFKDATVFIVAHRFSTIMQTDKILVLERGKIVEQGRHNYLLEKKGYYSNLYYEQFKERDRMILSEKQSSKR